MKYVPSRDGQRFLANSQSGEPVPEADHHGGELDSSVEDVSLGATQVVFYA